MNLNLNLDHGLAQQQQLNLAPQLLQWLRLLQVNALHLDHMVRHELDSNPALEAVDEADLHADEPVGEEFDDMPRDTSEDSILDERMDALKELSMDWDENNHGSSADASAMQDRMDYRMNAITETPGIRQVLLKQVAVMGLSDEIKAAAEWIIGTLNDRGYLAVSLESLAEESGMALTTLQEALTCVQGCEPPGIGARDLKECLLLQLSGQDAQHALPRLIVERYIEAVAQGRIEAIAAQLNVTADEVEAAIHMIRSLNPYPGKISEADEPITTVEPDIIIRLNEQDEFEIEVMERHAPRLRISHACRALIERGNLSRGDLAYVRGRIRAAMFLIEGLRKREQTLRRIATEIVRVQHRFLRGEEKVIRPLTMAKVAAIIGVHDTTVSRALADKYVDTPVGILPMKHFFQSGYQCEDGSALTPDMVRSRIERIILKEDPAAPVKDDLIARTLREEGIPVARRTVAKYRGELGLPSSKERAAQTTCACDEEQPLAQSA